MDEQVEATGEPKETGSRSPQTTRHLLVPLDLSDSSENCISTVIALAAALDARVTLLHVMEPGNGTNGSRSMDALGWEIQRREAHERLQKTRARFAEPKLRADIKIVQGRAVDQICAESSAPGVDLTVLSRHGKSGNGQWSLGSTAHKVLACTHGSVLIVPSVNPGAEASWRLPPRRIMVPLDGSVRAECALAVARSVAAAFDAQLVLLSVVGSFQGPHERLLSEEDARLAREVAHRWERRARQYLVGLLGEIKPSINEVRHVVESCVDVRKALLEVVAREHIDLVISSAHGSTCDSSRSHGSMAEHLVTHCPSPVLLVQDVDLPPTTERNQEHNSSPLADGRLE